MQKDKVGTYVLITNPSKQHLLAYDVDRTFICDLEGHAVYEKNAVSAS